MKPRRRAKKTVSEIFAEGRPIDEALRRAAREAILRHKRAGNRIVIWKNGRIAWVEPDEVLRELDAALEISPKPR